MTSARERQQRTAAKARLAREMAERQEAAKQRRQRLAIIGATAGILVVLGGTAWAVTAMTGEDDDPVAAGEASPPPTDPATDPATDVAAEPGECVWNADAGEWAVDVGTPPADEPREGTQVMTVSTNHGDVQVEMDLGQSPCVAASFAHLAGAEFYDGTKCHRMFPGMLQCGDPNARGDGYREEDGRGGPAYRFADENLPSPADDPPYPAGTVAMANSGPDTNGSQFFFIYEDLYLAPDYAVVGTITEGLDVLQGIGAEGHDGAFEPGPGGGHPNAEVVIEALRVDAPST